jgi:small subunit ribosomal protein S13
MVILNNSIKFLKSKFFGINLHLLYISLSYIGLSYQKIYINNNNLKLNNIDIKKLIQFIESSFLINTLLRDKIFINIRKYRVLKGYIGMRHIYNLPVHGQRTKTNAKTCKRKKSAK